jgi:hypothetical protein
VQNPDVSIIVPQKDETRLADIDDGGVTRFRHVAVDADADPVLMKEDVQIGLEDIFARVEARRQ